ncbi:MAG: PQQ-binding-like beta-propeller repeat protein [Verrucomicrobiota bacterium]
MTTLAVVPIFVNAGAAILPAVLGGTISLAAILFKPSEWLRICRTRPVVPLGMVAVGILLWLAPGWFTRAPAASSRNNNTTSGETHWVRFALDLQQAETRGASQPEASQPDTTTSATNLPNYFRAGPSRTGHTGGPSPVGLQALWEYPGEENAMMLSSPIVNGDAVYGASTVLDPPGSYGAVFRLNAATGEAVWCTPLKDPRTKKDFKGFFSSPALSADGKSLVIGQGLHLDFESELVCLDTATGTVRWMIPTPLHVEGSPAIKGDIVVAGAGAVEKGPEHKPRGDPEKEGNPGYVFAARISDGKLLWTYPVIDPESSPAIVDGVAYIGSGVNGNAVCALRIAPDEELKAMRLDRLVWKTPTPYPATGAVSIDGDLVIIGCGKGDFVFAAPDPEGLVVALDRATGTIRWKTAIPDAVLGAIAIRDGKAIVPVRNGEVIALDLSHNGSILWRTPLGENAAVLAAPAFTGSHVYAINQRGYLSVLDANNGKVIDRLYLNSPNKPGEQGLCISAPFITGGKLFIGTETGGLRALTGKNLIK